MRDKERILTLLKEEFGRWDAILASLSEDQAVSLQLPNGWTVKDLVAHLMAWQQVSIARLEAALQGGEPALPMWLRGSPPESEEEINLYNARIDEMYLEQPWDQIYRMWHAGFSKVVRLAEEIPADDLIDTRKYPWLRGYPLIAVLEGTYGHHQRDHFPSFSRTVREALDGQTPPPA